MSGLLPFACAVVIAIPAGVIAFMQSVASGKAFMSIARQPEVLAQIKTLLFVALAFMETLAIYCLLISFMLVNKIS